MHIMDHLINFDIPVLIFQVKAIQFGTNVGLNILLNISSGFMITTKVFIRRIFNAFSSFAYWRLPLVLPRPLFSVIIFKRGKHIYCPRCSDEFDYGDSASPNSRIMANLMSWTILALMGSFCKLELSNFVIDAGLNMFLKSLESPLIKYAHIASTTHVQTFL